MSDENSNESAEALAAAEDNEPRAVAHEPQGDQSDAAPQALGTENHPTPAELGEALAGVHQRLAELETGVQVLTKQVSFVPPQVRALGGKVDGLATSISEPRCRSLLLNMLSIYDLVAQMLRAGEADLDEGGDQLRNYNVLLTQIEQILESNGLSKIDTDGNFDAELHRAVKRQDTDDPAQDRRVLQVLREGFRTEQAVLRYAEVVVGRHAASEKAKNETESQD